MNLGQMLNALFATLSLGSAGPLFNLAYQPPVLVQAVSVANANTIGISSTKSGNLLVVAITINGGGSAKTVSTVKDSNNNNFVNASATCNNGTNTIEIWYYPNSIAGATAVNVTYNAAPTGAQLFFMEVQGIRTSSPLDVTNIKNLQGNTTNPTSPSVTPNFQRDFVVAAVVADQVITAVSAPYTNHTVRNGNVAAYTFMSAATATSASWTESPSGGYCSSIAAFKGLW